MSCQKTNRTVQSSSDRTRQRKSWFLQAFGGDFDRWIDEQLDRLEASQAGFVTTSSQRRSLQRATNGTSPSTRTT